MIQEIKETWRGMEAHKKKSLGYTFALFFLSLFSYPLMRSAVEALFIHEMGAKASPVVWLLSVVFLALSIFIYNRLQPLLGINRLFLYTIAAFIVSFGLIFVLYGSGISMMVYPLFIFKEIYIILFIHMILGFFNALVSGDEAKLFYGALGGIGSLGGVLGGLLVTQLATVMSNQSILYISLIPFLLIALLTWQLEEHHDVQNEREKLRQVDALRSLKGVGDYVFYVVMVVVLTQFIVNVINLKFNFVVENEFASSEAKTHFFGQVYTAINGLSFIMQFLLMPFILKLIRVRTLHLLFPFAYLFALSLGLGQTLPLLMGAGIMYVGVKAIDYSLFTVAKELLYFPLSLQQKFGIKYIADIVFYRLSKGLISFVLISFQEPQHLNTILVISFSLWVLVSVALFFKNRKLEMGRGL